MELDKETSTLLSILQQKCSITDYGDNKYKCALEILTKLGIIDSVFTNTLDTNNLSIIENRPKIPLSTFRYKTEYNQLSLLGYGGNGIVYTVKNILDSNIYAIKKINISSKNIKDVKVPLSEINILSKLNHKNIVRYYNSWIEPILDDYNDDFLSPNSLHQEDILDLECDDFIPDYSIYIQMELCNNGNLSSWLMNRKLIHLNTNKNRLLQIIDGLEYLHNINVIHRDLKPSNIFLSNETIKIGDFGISTLNINNKIYSTIGSDFYIDKWETNNTFNLDIYSLGIIIFELMYLFNTTMERCEILSTIHSNYPEQLINKNINSLIISCITPELDNRISLLNLKKEMKLLENNLLLQ